MHDTDPAWLEEQSAASMRRLLPRPDEVRRYIDPGECPISYNPQLMVLARTG